MDDIKLALLGDHEAAKRLTDAGVLLPCPWCGSVGITHYKRGGSVDMVCLNCGTSKFAAGSDYNLCRIWNTRAPILSAAEMEMLEGME